MVGWLVGWLTDVGDVGNVDVRETELHVCVRGTLIFGFLTDYLLIGWLIDRIDINLFFSFFLFSFPLSSFICFSFRVYSLPLLLALHHLFFVLSRFRWPVTESTASSLQRPSFSSPFPLPSPSFSFHLLFSDTNFNPAGDV